MSESDDADSNGSRQKILGFRSKDLAALEDDVEYLWKSSVPANSGPRSSIPILDAPPSSLEFCRDFVSASRPCIIRNALLGEDGQPLAFDLDDMAEKGWLDADETFLTVNVTPDGHGDCVRPVNSSEPSVSNAETELCFVQPKECRMALSDFRNKLRSPTHRNLKGSVLYDVNGRPSLDENNSHSYSAKAELPNASIAYYSQQNDCLRTELAPLASLLPPTIDWAAEVFQTPLEAINLWIGNENAVSSCHKDHYENLFYVASGEKIFWLCPPANAPCLYARRKYRTGIFGVSASENGELEWTVELNRSDDCKTQWIHPDIAILSQSDDSLEKKVLLEHYPLLKYVHPIEVRVQAGELLYLPSLWFHRVSQSCETVGINYWYDMKFDGNPLWCYFHFMENLPEQF